jgi:hypothetical protein
LTPGTRRNGVSAFGLFKRSDHDGEQATQHPQAGSAADRYTGRHADPRGKAARKLSGRAVPAAGAAAALVVGAAAYLLVAGGGHPQGADLSADMALPGHLSGATHAGVGADSAAATMIRSGATTGRPAASASAKPQASRSAPAPASAAPKAKAAPAAATKAPAAAHATVKPTAAAPAPAAKTLSCNLSDGLLPDNVTAIVTFLLAHGYSDNAAAGIAGNMYQESKGNPESEGMGGGGLIGFTPLPGGYVTGNPATDLQTQLEAVLTYNQQWSGYLPELNDAASPADAAYIYVTDFERAGIPAASTREASAEDVASACGI